MFVLLRVSKSRKKHEKILNIFDSHVKASLYLDKFLYVQRYVLKNSDFLNLYDLKIMNC